jgi:hypothetical protein
MRAPFSLCRLILMAGPLAVVGACTDVPDFDTSAHLSATRAYPTIEPLGQVVVVGGAPVVTETDSAALQARAVALRARAAANPPEPVDPLLLQKAKALSAEP